MSDIYDRITTGQLATIKGRRAVYLYYASYGGGSRPLWAIEGLRAQFTTREIWGYRQAICRKVSPANVELELENGQVEIIPLKEIGRYDQFDPQRHEEWFVFDEQDILLLPMDGAEKK